MASLEITAISCDLGRSSTLVSPSARHAGMKVVGASVIAARGENGATVVTTARSVQRRSVAGGNYAQSCQNELVRRAL